MFFMTLLFLALVVFGVPIAFALIGATLVAILLEGLSPIIVSQMLVEGLLPFPILAIPLFYFVGLAANLGGTTDNIMALSARIIGRVRGSLGHINIVASMFFGGVSGSSAADTASIGAIMIPQMIKQNYPKSVAVAITACSSTMGNIIPPSILMVVYGAFGNLSIAAMFLGGIIPGIMIGLGQMLIWRLISGRHELNETAAETQVKKLTRADTAQVFAMLGVPVLIISGIVLGIFTATESAVVAFAYVMMLHVVFRSCTFGEMVRLFRDGGKFVALPLIMTAAAACFAWMLAYYDAPATVSGLVAGMTDSPVFAILIVVAVFMLIGMVIDTLPAIIMFLPIVQAIAAANGVDQIQMGVIVVLTCAVGLVTPPFGVCLLIASQIADARIIDMLPMTFLFLLSSLVVIALCILFPGIITFLPSLFI